MREPASLRACELKTELSGSDLQESWGDVACSAQDGPDTMTSPHGG
jgi:hypothetical protein